MGTPTREPATTSLPFGARPRQSRGIRAAHRGTAAFRMVFLIAVSGFLVAAVLATIVAGLIIAVNGRLP